MLKKRNNASFILDNSIQPLSSSELMHLFNSCKCNPKIQFFYVVSDKHCLIPFSTYLRAESKAPRGHVWTQQPTSKTRGGFESAAAYSEGRDGERDRTVQVKGFQLCQGDRDFKIWGTLRVRQSIKKLFGLVMSILVTKISYKVLSRRAVNLLSFIFTVIYRFLDKIFVKLLSLFRFNFCRFPV